MSQFSSYRTQLRKKWKKTSASEKTAYIGCAGVAVTAFVTALSTIIAAMISGKPSPTVIPSTATYVKPTSPPTIAPTESTAFLRLDALDYNDGCEGDIFAIPETVSVPTFPSQSDPVKRYRETLGFLQETGFQIAYDGVANDGSNPYLNDYLAGSLYYCEPTTNIFQTLWNTSSERVLIKTITIVVEAYDYEPSSIPSDYKFVFLFPPNLTGFGNQIPFQRFEGNIKPTTNALSLPLQSPLLLEAGDPIQVGIYLRFDETGTYRIHILYEITDSKGNSSEANSESVVTKWGHVNELIVKDLEPADVK